MSASAEIEQRQQGSRCRTGIVPPRSFAQKERVSLCVWKALQDGEELVNEIKSQSFFPDGEVEVADRFRSKTSIILCGSGAHQAALRLVQLRSPSVPWQNVSDNTRDWVCPRWSCAGLPLNIRGRIDCLHCGNPKPRNLQESEVSWKEALSKATNIPPRTSSPQVVLHDVQEREKRRRIAVDTEYPSIADFVSHPNSDDERVRITIWNPETCDDDTLVSKLEETLSPCFQGRITICERHQQQKSSKAVVEVKGMGAHQAVMLLEQLSPGPTGDRPWRSCSIHHREWNCPLLTCVGVDFNIDFCNSMKPSKCKNCGQGRPKSLRESARIWCMELQKGQGKEQLRNEPPRAVSPSQSPSYCANDPPPSTCSDPQHESPRPDGEFGVWYDAKMAAGYGPRELLCDHKIILNRTKDPIKGLLSFSKRSRVWAFDVNANSGAKGWVWSDSIDSFFDLYQELAGKDRHAYEVIEEDTPCRMVYDLDMCTEEGANGNRDDTWMAKEIVRETQCIMGAGWGEKDGLSFDNEVLVAHGTRKKSYHIIMKAFDGKGKEVLMKDFASCKTVAQMVNSNLGEKILVDRMPGHGNKSSPLGTISFIDLSIYTKDRPFRLIFSSKITSPERPFVPDVRFGERNIEDMRSLLKGTLVVPLISRDGIRADFIEIPENRGDNLVNKDGSWANVEGRDHGDKRATTSFSDIFPLLDLGKGKIYSRNLGRDIGAPFDILLPWVEELAKQLPGAQRVGPVVADARYERSIVEAYVHFTINRRFASHCYCVGRSHAQNNVMISVGLFSQTAYQRCWDSQCRGPMCNKMKARHLLSSSPPCGAIPSMESITVFEQGLGLFGQGGEREKGVDA